MPDGQAYNRDGRTAMADDREYYTAEHKGGERHLRYKQHCVRLAERGGVLRACACYNNEIVGILVCAYREDTLAQFMTTGFFGENAPTFLCEPDGRVIAKSASGVEDASSIEDVFAGESLNHITIGQIKQDVADGTSASFTFHSAEGIGNTYMMRLPSYNWTLVRLFPANITNGMVERAKSFGSSHCRGRADSIPYRAFGVHDAGASAQSAAVAGTAGGHAHHRCLYELVQQLVVR